MQQFDSGNESVARTSRCLAEDSESVVPSKCMTRAALYARVSSDAQQKEGTIESQVAELRKQIATAGHELVREYIDDGITGTILERPAAYLFVRVLHGEADRKAGCGKSARPV